MTQILKELEVRPFMPKDQAEAKRVILEGLGEHFNFIIDENKNPDLKDIAAFYAKDFFLVAVMDEKIIGTGALVREANDTGRIVRMSVGRAQRRKGIGKEIIKHLLDKACSLGYQRVVLETNDDWHDAIAFYKSCGFKEIGRRASEIDFALSLLGL